MEDSINNNNDIIRGLSSSEVEERVKLGQVNKTKMIAGKTVWEILRTNVFSFFNILLFVVAGFIIYANSQTYLNFGQWFASLFFMVVLISNIVIGLFQDFKAKHLMNKLKVITTPMCKVIRDGQEIEIKPSQLVLDDIIILKPGDQVPSDSTQLSTKVSVNESMLTGESRDIAKNKGDLLYSGSYITSGKCYAKVVKVGKDNYIETITEKAKAFKRNPSHILKSLKVLFRILGIVVIGITIMSVSILISFKVATAGTFTGKDFVELIRPTAGQLVAMIPAGLYLLTSVALASGVLSLYRKRANVQDFYSIEMLARSDMICVDKTGTITDGNLSVLKIDNVSRLNDDEVGSIVSSIVAATNDDNATARILKKYFDAYAPFEVSAVLPFSSENKYSGISTKIGITYLIGAFEFMNIKNKSVLAKQCDDYASKGYRVIVLARGMHPIKGDTYKEEVELVAFIVLQDHIKDDAKETFAWFQQNGVQVRVISGDNALTVSEIATIAGIDGAEKYISLEGMSIEEVKTIANDYVVFGRVTPEQKEALIIALKDAGHTVAMVGDGINDMLALKRADCSIAMNSGALSARNVSHVVLMDDNFSTMPAVVGEGRRVINNLQRTGSLFLTKTIFAIAMALTFIFVSLATKGVYRYPFSTNNMVLWEAFAIGLASFFVALEPDNKPIKSGFLRNIFWKAAPYGATIVIATLFCFLLFLFNNHGIYTGVTEYGVDLLNSALGRYGATGISVLVFTALSLFVLFQTCRPLTLYRGIVCGGATLIASIVIIICFCVHGENVLNIDFERLTGENYLVAVVIIVAIISLTLLGDALMIAFSKKKKKEDSKNED